MTGLRIKGASSSMRSPDNVGIVKAKEHYKGNENANALPEPSEQPVEGNQLSKDPKGGNDSTGSFPGDILQRFTARAEAWKRDLRPGDHIYTWRLSALLVYAHHGIYIGNNNVVHFTSVSSRRRRCDCRQGNNGVILSCLDCFLKGGIGHQYKYGVSKAALLFHLLLDRSCTVAESDPPDTVIRRAMHLLQNGFGKYHLWRKNCEDFALYCKTGLFVQGKLCGASGQVLALRGHFTRYREDIGVRLDKIKLPVEHIFPDAVAESSTNIFKFKSS